MEFLLQVAFSGLTLGSLYALVGLGFVIIFKATGVVNFAQGEMVMLGAMFALVAHLDLRWPFVPAILVAVGLAGATGVVLERVAFRPLLRAPVVTVILSTVAVGQMLRSGVRIVRGQELSLFPPMLPTDPIRIGGLTVTPLSLAIIAISLLLVAAFTGMFQFTRLGKGMQAVAQNKDAASMVGISVPRTYARIWGISSALAGAAGILLAPLIIISPDMGIIANKGFAGAILGGFNSLLGAVVGGFLLGIIENLAGVYVGGSMKDVVAFVVLVAVLSIRPAGLLGRPEQRRA